MSADISGKSDDEASLQKKYFDQPYIKHEWEELVTKLCKLDDPKLKKIGYEELEKIRAYQRGVSILDGV
jgi:hypothetical protein